MKSYNDFDDDYGLQRRGNNANGRPTRVRDSTENPPASSNGSPAPGRSPRISPPPGRASRQDLPNGLGVNSGAVGIRARMSRPDSATQLAESAAPHNSLFVTPIFPQLPMTVTASCNPWAIMLEQACQTLEGIFAPLLEAVLCECTSTGLIPADQVALAPPTRSPRVVNTTLVAAAAAAAAASCASSSIAPAGAPGARSSTDTGRSTGDGSGVTRHSPSGSGSEGLGLGGMDALQLPPPPYDAATCIDLLLRHDWLSYNKFPVTIRKRLEAASAGVHQLLKEPESLNGSTVLSTEQAMRSIVQDCLKAMGLPSLLGTGSRQFMAFVRHIRPEFESQLIYFDVLIADCQVTAQDMEARGQVQLRKEIAV